MARRRWQTTSPPSDPLPLDEAGVRDQFDPNTFQRGDQYQRQGRVLDVLLRHDGALPSLTASVRGNGANVYRVTIDLTPTDGTTVCDGFCTCPVTVDCKHVVAALLQGVRQGVFVDPQPPPVADQAFSRLSVKQQAVPAPGKAVDPLAGPMGSWLDQLSEAFGPTAAQALPGARPGAAAPPPESLLYCFDVRQVSHGGERISMALVAARPLKAGGWGTPRPMTLSTVAHSTARYVTDSDRAVARVLLADSIVQTNAWPVSGTPDTLEWAITKILATGRAYWRSKDGAKLVRGPDRPGRLTWKLTATGDQVPTIAADEAGLVTLPGPSPWAVDPLTGACGRLLLPIPPELLKPLLEAPAIPPEAALALGEALARRFPGLAIAAPRTDIAVVVDTSPPIPVLRLSSNKLPQQPYWGRGTSPGEEWVDGAWLSFDYGGVEIAPHTPLADLRDVAGNTVRVRKRLPDVERAAVARIAGLGLARPATYSEPRLARALDGGGLTFPMVPNPRAYGQYIPADPFRWPAFMHEAVPQLAAAGWRIVVEESFRHRVVSAAGEWMAEIEDKGGWWFSLDLGIAVEGERIALLPVLISALAKLKPGQPLETLAATGTLYCGMADGRTLALPFERVRDLVAVLVELFGERPPGNDRAIDLSLAQAMGLEAIAEATRLRWVGGQRLRDLASRLLRDGIGADDRPIPAGFTAELRSYQRTGFGWMGFLAAQGLGGVLADDMGLGKTVQTLAHILAERNAGGMRAPFLVICPTSLVGTWRDEAARFAPDLKVLIMHGQGRPRDRGAFDGIDMVISTYPLLTRDGDLLAEVEWHGVVLDEAQAIKNPGSRWTQMACRLKAGHRLCLTGTPVENHLGEAWSLFAFLMPGLLGDARAFARMFRTPIEKKNDAERRQLLSRRLKPFLLRRTKAEVAAELPPKTEMVRWIDLEGGQRDLYETLRLAMDEKVRQAVASKGLGRSAIVILDALLKLRQACCDPRLVRLQAGSKAGRGSAKLEALMDLLPALVEEGRRILLFSQFTSMLDLIKPELVKAGIAFVELTGETADRETPVKAFQSGAVPVFVISLKAGGVGLTLTAADTVIHYDPWWNPAVEDQATDRAHRIGQDKPVFVYKLIAAGTVEERMLELQSRKRSVAAALFDPDAGGSLAFTAEDLAALFQPIA